MLSLRAASWRFDLRRDSDGVRGLAGLDVALLVRFACRGEVPPVQQALAKIGRLLHAPAVRTATLQSGAEMVFATSRQRRRFGSKFRQDGG